LLCKRSDRNIAANTRTVSRARPLWVVSVRQGPNLVAPGIPLFFVAGLKIFLAHYLVNTRKMVIELGRQSRPGVPLDTNSVSWSTGMLDAILSLARLFPVLDDIGASEGEPRLQRRREAHGRSLHAQLPIGRPMIMQDILRRVSKAIRPPRSTSRPRPRRQPTRPSGA
jgi:hypothetical protein